METLELLIRNTSEVLTLEGSPQEPAERALLLERARPQDLGTQPVLQACHVLGRLIGTLARPPRPPFPRLSDTARRWRAELADAAWLDGSFPRRFLHCRLRTVRVEV